MGPVEWLGIIIEICLVIVAIAATTAIEKKRPTETINPATEDDIRIAQS